MIRKTLRKAKHAHKKLTHKIKESTSAKKNYIYSIDAPKTENIETKTVLVEGWIISKQRKQFTLRIKNNGNVVVPKIGENRVDVYKTHGEEYGEGARFSGFSSEFEYSDGKIAIEINDGRGFREIFSKQIHHGVDRTPKYFYNKDLAWRMAEHKNLIENRRSYYFEEETVNSFVKAEGDPRLMAIYLPQFHPIAENDKAWGKGFTEWHNVAAGESRYVGHQQPILPSSLGFYDLRFDEKIFEQINLAKKYGIHGFAFYYYWFSGKKILDTPLNTFLAHSEWDFNFSICWANENWTKRWDGRDSDVIIQQEYKDDDPINFIKDVEDILTDPRYLRYEGKPVLTVYRPSHLKDPKVYADIWRRYMREKHNVELHLVSCISFDDNDPTDFGFDAAMDFAPLSAFFKQQYFQDGTYPYITVEDKLLDRNFTGVVADYRTLAETKELIDCYKFKTHGCVTPSWDNDARKKGKGFIFANSNPDLYAKWLDNTLKHYTAKEKEPIVYINAWNEWAEGATIEPTQHLGYATLNRTAEVLAKYSNNPKNQNNFRAYQIDAPKNKLAVVVHLYHPDMWPIIVDNLRKIPEPFDLFISLSEKDRDTVIESPFKNCNVYINTLPNRGRDVLPFLYMLRRISTAGYKYVLKIHSKKSSHRDDGAEWFNELIEGLLPGQKQIKTILSSLNNDYSLVGPDNHIVSLARHMGSNKHILTHLLIRTYGEARAHSIIAKPESYPFVGGTMFWANVDSLRPLLELDLMPDDFQSEHGQVDGTIAHAIERYIGVVSQVSGNGLAVLEADGTLRRVSGEFTGKYKFAP